MDQQAESGRHTDQHGWQRTCKDNIWIERFWNTIKREHIYLNPADDGLELYRGIKVYIDYYNNKRAHQGIGRIRPCEAYKREAA